MGQEELEHLIGKTKKDLEELEDEEEGDEKTSQGDDVEKEEEMDDSASADGSEEAGENKTEMDEDAAIEAKYGMDDYGRVFSLCCIHLVNNVFMFLLR